MRYVVTTNLRVHLNHNFRESGLYYNNNVITTVAGWKIVDIFKGIDRESGQGVYWCTPGTGGPAGWQLQRS